MHLRKLVVSGLALTIAISACGRDPSGPTLEPGIHVVAGADVADTVDAVPLQALVVQVVGEDRRPVPMAVVRFESLPLPNSWPSAPTVLVGALAEQQFRPFAVDTTDSEGRASVRIQLWRRAGAGGVIVAVPLLGAADTARYTILPGAPADLAAAPADSAVFVGGSYALRAAVVDRYGNAREDAVTYMAASGPVAVDNEASTVEGTAIGRAMVIADAHGLRDTSHVSVVPAGVLAVGGSQGLSIFNMDGSGYRLLPTGLTLNPRWAPSGDRIAFGRQHDGRLLLTDLQGNTQALIANDTTPGDHFWPKYSRDGAWVYFTSAADQVLSWRVRSDGTDLQRISGSDVHGNEGNPSPSPDGTRIAEYVHGGSDAYIRVRDLAGGAVTGKLAPGHDPNWSPVDEQIAFNGTEQYDNGSIRVVRSDGSGLRIIGPATRGYEFGHDWSPDGKWIVARSRITGALDLIEVETGRILPLAFTQGLRDPTWRP